MRASDWYGYFLDALKNNSYKIVKEKESLHAIGNTAPRIIVIEDNAKNKSKLVFIKHPSRAFPWKEWGTFIKKQLGKITNSLN